MTNKFHFSRQVEGIVLMSTVPSMELAKLIAHQLVSRQLAACVQIMPQATSVYMWNNKVCEDSEHLLIIKCPQACYQAVESCIVELHPYDTPEIIALPIIQGLPSYLNWMSNVTYET